MHMALLECGATYLQYEKNVLPLVREYAFLNTPWCGAKFRSNESGSVREQRNQNHEWQRDTEQ
jgi:hypothetical protein